MADVFVSYKREDAARVRPLVSALESEGFTVWWDQRMLPGERIPAVIHKVLDEVSCVLVVWSALSVESNWVPDEAAYGRDHNILVPISLDRVPSPLGFQQLHVEDLSGWDGDADDARFQKVASAIRAHQSDARRSDDARTPAIQPSLDTTALERHYHATQHKRVFLIVGSFNEEWQIALNVQIIQAVQRADLLCTVIAPTEDHSVDQQRRLLESVKTDGSDYLGGFVVGSGWPDHLIPELLALLTRRVSPVVIVDRNPPPELKNIPPNVAYVSVSDAAGGELAAEAVLQLSDEPPIRRILVIAGFAKATRHNSFDKRLKASEKLSHCEIVITEDGKFDRWIAENIAFNLLSDALKIKRPFDVVFCTADAMTVGCLDAITRISRRGGAHKTRVVGYDGTPTTLSLIDSRRSPLVRIVIQDTRDIASAAVEQLLRLHQPGGENAGDVVWIRPYLYPRLRTA